MNPGDFQIGRATLDDLPALIELAGSHHLNPQTIERDLRDFQLAIDADNQLAGAIAMQSFELNGRIHSELIVDFAHSESIRSLIWQRFQSIAKSLGLATLWTQESAPFWRQHGFSEATPEFLEKLPLGWRQYEEKWYCLKLRDEALLKKALNQEFIRMVEAGQKPILSSKSVNTFKYFGVVVAILVAMAAIALCVMILKYLPALNQRLHR